MTYACSFIHYPLVYSFIFIKMIWEKYINKIFVTRDNQNRAGDNSEGENKIIGHVLRISICLK